MGDVSLVKFFNGSTSLAFGLRGAIHRQMYYQLPFGVYCRMWRPDKGRLSQNAQDIIEEVYLNA